MSNDFFGDLREEISNDIRNFYTDNYDEDRFGRLSRNQSIKAYLKGLLYALPLLKTLLFEQFRKKNKELDYLYSKLKDRDSRELMVKLFAYRLMGRHKVKLPLNNADSWRQREEVRSLIINDKIIPVEFMNWHLNHFNVKSLGYDIEMFHLPLGIMNRFILHQYERYKHGSVCKVERGDVVIDAGGCWGDTALYFAHECGPEGRVFTFEFLPSNLEIMAKNIDLNPHLKNRIEIVANPLWSSSDEILYGTDQGPTSKVSRDKTPSADFKVFTVAIDDFIARNNIERIDFIKMDIEGAELEALKGARNTIERFKPKMAISLYHKVEDFISIPKLLNSLQANYDFYLAHYTIHLEETILMAIPQVKM